MSLQLGLMALIVCVWAELITYVRSRKPRAWRNLGAAWSVVAVFGSAGLITAGATHGNWWPLILPALASLLVSLVAMFRPMLANNREHADGPAWD